MENQGSYVTSKDEYITGRLGFTAEPAGKTRIFAIADYWSQVSLKVIQISLYNTLKTISTDATADQNKGFKTLVKESHGSETYCFDLTSATDRIPAVMQKHRLELMGGKNLGDSWLQLMTDRTFYIKYLKQSVRWTVGQPLGLLSSFPSFALWHHDIIQFAANLERFEKGKPLHFFKDYRLLGDDVVIYDKKVAGIYQCLLKKIGIPINLSKSIIGDKLNSQIEFAKRLSLNGCEMSSIKRNILTKYGKSYMLDLVDILFEREFISKDTHQNLAFQGFSTEASEQLNFIIWLRSSSSAPFKGSEDDLEIVREDFNDKLKAKRKQSIMAKLDEIEKFLFGSDPVKRHFVSSSLPHSDAALGLGEQTIDPLVLHPIIWAMKQIGLDLSEILAGIFSGDSDVNPVEYLPLNWSKGFFTTRKSRGVFLSAIYLDILRDYKNEFALRKKGLSDD
jgi:hypothetical protein